MATLIRTTPFTSIVVRPAEKNCFCPAISDQFLISKSVVGSVTRGSFISLDVSNGRSKFFHGRSSSGIAVSAMSNSSGSVSSPLITEDTTNLLENMDVFDLNGKAIKISDLWKDRKAVVAFARHFGCVLCRKRADLLASVKAKVFYEQTKFRGENLRKGGILSSEFLPQQSSLRYVDMKPGALYSHYKKLGLEQLHVWPEVYADPNYSSYKALKFVSGISTTFTPKAGLKIIQLYMEGYRQDWELSFEKDTRTKGGWQQGGIIVAGPGKSNISYIHKDKEAGDDPEIEDVLKACCS